MATAQSNSTRQAHPFTALRSFPWFTPHILSVATIREVQRLIDPTILGGNVLEVRISLLLTFKST